MTTTQTDEHGQRDWHAGIQTHRPSWLVINHLCQWFAERREVARTFFLLLQLCAFSSTRKAKIQYTSFPVVSPEVFKYLREMYSVRFTERLPSALVSAVRGHDYKLLKRQCHSHSRLTFFSYGVVTLWNDLPSEVVSAPSLNTFKGRLDKYWGHHCYSLDPSVFGQRQPVNSQQVTVA